MYKGRVTAVLPGLLESQIDSDRKIKVTHYKNAPATSFEMRQPEEFHKVYRRKRKVFSKHNMTRL